MLGGLLVLLFFNRLDIRVWDTCSFALREEIQKRVGGNNDMHRFYVSAGYAAPESYIAHGGGIGEYVYTNSHEAVKDSLGRGFKFIEIDLHETSDGHLIGCHDWNRFKKALGVDDSLEFPLAYEDIKGCKLDGKYTLLEGREIAEIMRKAPDFVLVTDKIDNFELLLREIPYPERMIVEVFSPESYAKALRSGVKYPAFCIARPADLLTAEWYGFPIVTMSASDLFGKAWKIELVRRLHSRNVTILLYDFTGHSDNPTFLHEHLGKTVSKFYTDNWAPTKLP